MKHFYWPYELATPNQRSKSRSGVLFRVEYDRGWFGHGDCHPWPDLGDWTVEQQLAAFHTKDGTPLLVGALSSAFFDYCARRENRSLFEGMQIPLSHASFPWGLDDVEATLQSLHQLKAEGFSEIKIKSGADLMGRAGDVARIGIVSRDVGLKVRLDLNARTSYEAVTAALEMISLSANGLDWLDWVEDPCLYSISDWKRLREELGIRLALDFAADPLKTELAGAVDVVVLKPAVQDCDRVLSRAKSLDLPVCITSYLDHPVGQTYAAWWAAQAASQGFKLETCGLLTHNVYEPSAFSERLRTDGPRLIPPTGTGIGFDDLLESLPWEAMP